MLIHGTHGLSLALEPPRHQLQRGALAQLPGE